MKERSAVIFTLKFSELILCSVCLAIHIVASFFIHEPLPHDILSCGVFVCFLLNSLIGCMSIVLSTHVPLQLDAILNSIASILFLFTSILSMVYAENDEHLLFLTDNEEVNHTFFTACRRQSVWALVTATLFALHASMVWDMHLIPDRVYGRIDEAKQPIQLHFLPFRFCMWLGKRTNNAWIQAIVQRMQLTESDSTSGPFKSKINASLDRRRSV